MITSIFGKSKPINFVLVLFILAIAFFSLRFNGLLTEGSVLQFCIALGVFLVLYFTLLVLNFTTNKNSLTLNNNYEILLCSVFILLLPESVSNPYKIVANLCVWLALRRILSLHSQRNTKRKLLDASLWLCLSVFLDVYTLLYFPLILIALVAFRDNVLNHWLIPFAAILVTGLISVALSLVINNTAFSFIDTFAVSLDFTPFQPLNFSVAITMFIVFAIWCVLQYVISLKQVAKTTRPLYTIVYLALAIGFCVVIVNTPKNGSSFLYVVFPLALVVSNYLDTITKTWVKEIIFGGVFIAAIVNLWL